MGQRLGQHFLRTPWAARALARAAGISASDTVLEIGPGKGALTNELLATGAHVIAVEKDKHLVAELRKKFAVQLSSGRLVLVEKDIRDFDPRSSKLGAQSYVLAANIPYYITGEIIRTFLSSETHPRTIALLVQKEVAKRIVSKKESILSLSVKAYGTPRIAARVSRGNFSPPPAVDSAILTIKNISRDFFKGIPEQDFFRIVRAGFAAKRKFLVRNLAVGSSLPAVKNAFEACSIPEKVRAEDVPLETWKCLTQRLVAR